MIKIIKKILLKLKSILLKLKSRKLMIFFDNIIRKVIIRENFLIKLFNFYYKLKFKREWIWNLNPPHFYSHQASFF